MALLFASGSKFSSTFANQLLKVADGYDGIACKHQVSAAG